MIPDYGLLYSPGDVLLLGSPKDAEVVTVIDVSRDQKENALYTYAILRKNGQLTEMSCTMLNELTRQGVCKKIA